MNTFLYVYHHLNIFFCDVLVYFFLLICSLIHIYTRLPWCSDGKESACNVGDLGLIPELGRSPGGGRATHSSILPGEFPWIEEPGVLQYMGSQRVGHDWATKHIYIHTHIHILEYKLYVNSLWDKYLPILKLTSLNVIFGGTEILHCNVLQLISLFFYG